MCFLRCLSLGGLAVSFRVAPHPSLFLFALCFLRFGLSFVSWGLFCGLVGTMLGLCWAYLGPGWSNHASFKQELFLFSDLCESWVYVGLCWVMLSDVGLMPGFLWAMWAFGWCGFEIHAPRGPRIGQCWGRVGFTLGFLWAMLAPCWAYGLLMLGHVGIMAMLPPCREAFEAWRWASCVRASRGSYSEPFWSHDGFILIFFGWKINLVFVLFFKFFFPVLAFISFMFPLFS